MSEQEILHGPWESAFGDGRLFRVIRGHDGRPHAEAYDPAAEEHGWHQGSVSIGHEGASEIARLAAENSALELTVGEGHEIEGELLGALAMLTEEELKPCADGCHGHLGEKASAMVREARDAWTKLEAENYELKSQLRESLEESESWRASYKKHCEETGWIGLENERLKAEVEAKLEAAIAKGRREQSAYCCIVCRGSFSLAEARANIEAADRVLRAVPEGGE